MKSHRPISSFFALIKCPRASYQTSDWIELKHYIRRIALQAGSNAILYDKMIFDVSMVAKISRGCQIFAVLP